MVDEHETHRMVVAVQDGESRVVDAEGAFFRRDPGTAVGRSLEGLGLDVPEPRTDGLWEIVGEVKYDRGSNDPLGSPPREPSFWMSASANLLIHGDVVDFEFGPEDSSFPHREEPEYAS